MDISSFRKSKNLKTILGFTAIMVVGLLTFAAIQLTAKSNNSAGNLKLASPQDFTILGHDFEKNTIELLKEADTSANRRRIPLVKIPSQGRLKGTILTSRRCRDYYAFYKVPYAAPPVGELRFELVNETATKEINLNFEEMLPSIMGLQSYNQSEAQPMAQKFRELYFGNNPISNDTRVELLQLNSDSFVHSLRISALEHSSKKTKQPVYLYWLTKEPAGTYAEKYTQNFPPPYGASHADELQYLFLYDGYPEITTDSPWYNYSNTLVKMWADFAATGKPISPTNEWKPIDPADNGMKWFELGDNFREVEPVTKRMLLWDEYIPDLYWT